ncbi:hypothetical protein BpHYR1_037125 [Brachionus plicatilis]|uniref:C-type lectin domain-containing protein n=1 Tax=Brachionus plicatilis TaxID=10195 RepID=A0A3M7SYA5_BRAPC|nr:hypothetical protein BpHYR1_037125 [Brachionus plicatilis]
MYLRLIWVFISLTNGLNSELTLKDMNSRSFISQNLPDLLYYCSSHLNQKPVNWILRHKKCYNFEQIEANYPSSLKLCSTTPFSSINHLLHKNEFDVLKKEIDFYELYPNQSEFRIWLADNEYADHLCSNKSFAPIVQFNGSSCRTGCLGCALRSEKAFYTCVKNSEWKVPFNSYCNTMNLSQYQLGANLFYQTNEQIYVCQGDLKCIESSCLCEPNKNFINSYHCV